MLEFGADGYPTAGSINSFFEESSKFVGILISDVGRAKRDLGKNDTPYLRRVFCRSVLAMLEGFSRDLITHVLAFESHALLQDELKILKIRLGALETSFHAFEIYSEVYGTRSPLKRHSKKWKSLQSAIRTRNKITHPKSSGDLHISDEEVKNLLLAAQSIIDLYDDCLRRFEQSIVRRRAAIDAYLANRNQAPAAS